jgi:hypothetical protein
MRTLALVLAVLSVAAPLGCSNPCQDLGERLCDCTPTGTTKASCVQSVKTEVSNLNPSKSAQDVCQEALRTCYARDNIDFCDWINGRCGKASCMISEESYAVLSDPTLSPDPDHPGQALCPP